MAEDLAMALRNALERGESIGEAKISLINAGYKREDVEKAARVIEKSITKRKARKFKPLPPPVPPK